MKLCWGVILRPNERELIERLESDRPETRFAYWKERFVRREARGTRNLQFVPREQWPKSLIEEPIKTNVNYYDFDRKNWRSFRLGSVIDMYD